MGPAGHGDDAACWTLYAPAVPYGWRYAAFFERESYQAPGIFRARVFDDSFNRVIIQQTRDNPELIQNWPHACDRAQATFEDAASAFCYCLCYQRMHFESLSSIVDLGYLDEFQSPLIIDVGAGPATVPLALAQRRVQRLQRGPLSLRYFDIERSEPMRAIAEEYLQDRDLFVNHERYSISTIDQLLQSKPRIVELARGADVVLVALSYVLKQRDVNRQFALTISELTRACADHFDIPTYVLIQDTSAGPYDRYNAFLGSVAEGGWSIEGYERRLTQPHRKVQPDGTPTRQTNKPKNGNVVFRYGRAVRAVY